MHHGVEFLLPFDLDVPETFYSFLGFVRVIAVVVVFVCLFADAESEHVQGKELESSSGFCIVGYWGEERIFRAGFFVFVGVEGSEGSLDWVMLVDVQAEWTWKTHTFEHISSLTVEDTCSAFEILSTEKFGDCECVRLRFDRLVQIYSL